MDLKNELEFKMKIISIIILFTLTLYGNIFDDLNITDAQKAYEEKNYVQALNLLNKVRNQNSKIHYNIGNILYKMQKYEEAIIEYKKVIDSDLLHSANHNIANSYLMLENLDGAIEFYNKALTHDNNQRTLYNLEMTKKKKQQLSNRQIRDLNENVCEIQRKGLIEELTIDTIFDYFKIDENMKLYEDEQKGLTSKNENSRLTKDDNNLDIYIAKENEDLKSVRNKKEFKMNSYFEKKFENTEQLKDPKTLIVPMEKGIIDDNKKAW